jgi:putative phosphoribosyl transferase
MLDRQKMRFSDRFDAGELLADHLAEQLTGVAYNDIVVLALPRGGVPVASAIAKRFNAPLDLCLVRKLGVPG